MTRDKLTAVTSIGSDASSRRGRAALRHTLTLAFVLSAFVALPVCAQENQRLAFVTEYIRGLGAIEEARALDEKELATDQNPMAATIRGSTRMVLELQTQIEMLKSFNLGNTNGTQKLVGNIIEIDSAKIGRWQRMGEIAKALIAGPEPGTDYGKFSAEMPELNAQLYQISLIRTGRPRQNLRVMEQACQTSFAIVNHIACDLKTTPRVSLSEIWY